LSNAAVAAVRPLLGVFLTRGPDSYLLVARRPPLPTDGGTTHLSIVDSAGTAMAVTSTINTDFGSAVVSPTSGILLNNEMSDYTLATDGAPVGVNGVESGKCPLSSMSPSVLLGPGGAVVATVGGSGGPRIITAVSQVLLRAILGGEARPAAVTAPRVLHQRVPAVADLEGILGDIGYACAPALILCLGRCRPGRDRSCATCCSAGGTWSARGRSRRCRRSWWVRGDTLLPHRTRARRGGRRRIEARAVSSDSGGGEAWPGPEDQHCSCLLLRGLPNWFIVID